MPASRPHLGSRGPWLIFLETFSLAPGVIGSCRSCRLSLLLVHSTGNLVEIALLFAHDFAQILDLLLLPNPLHDDALLLGFGQSCLHLVHFPYLRRLLLLKPPDLFSQPGPTLFPVVQCPRIRDGTLQVRDFQQFAPSRKDLPSPADLRGRDLELPLDFLDLHFP